jgi:lambda family phage portal protein
MGLRSAVRKWRQSLANSIAPAADTPANISRSASATTPYEAGGTGRRATNWHASRLGPTTVLWGNLDIMRARCRDAIRNDPWAASAIDNFESQHIGNGIRPRWNLPNKELKQKVETEFARWATSTMCDYAGRVDFYGLQALAAREMFEAGEVFTKFIVRPKSWNMRVPLQLQLMESEQLSLFRNVWAHEGGVQGMPINNRIRTGIEFDPEGRRVAYHFYKEHPGETMFYPLDGLLFTRIPAEEILHSYKVFRVGQLRGQPHLSAVLTLLNELEQYTDAALVKKKVAAMFAGFIEKVNADADILPPDPNNPVGNLQPSQPIGVQPIQDAETLNTKLEPGTMNVLLPGEKITLPNLPSESDFESGSVAKFIFEPFSGRHDVMKSLEIGHSKKIIKHCICFESGFRNGTQQSLAASLPRVSAWVRTGPDAPKTETNSWRSARKTCATTSIVELDAGAAAREPSGPRRLRCPASRSSGRQ